MKIGLIIHSQSGHTYSVAQTLQKKLTAVGHSVIIERLNPIGDAHPGVKNLQLASIPDTAPYDALVFAAPVWAFTLSPVLTTYLNRVSSLKGKKIACFVTMGLPFPWMGGTRAIARIKSICESKGATIAGAEIIKWAGTPSEDKLAQAIDNLVKTL